MKKFLSLVLTGFIAAASFCGCSSDEISTEDLEYGATLRQLNDVPVEICFDSRFFSDEEMRVISNYYNAIQTKDGDLFLSTQSKEYIEYVEKNSGQTVDAFVEDIYNTTVAGVGGDYTYTYIEAVGCGDKSDDLSINEIIELMNSIYEDSGRDTTFEDTIKESKYAVFDIMADVNGTSYTYNDQVIYIFNCTDGIYIYG